MADEEQTKISKEASEHKQEAELGPQLELKWQAGQPKAANHVFTWAELNLGENYVSALLKILNTHFYLFCFMWVKLAVLKSSLSEAFFKIIIDNKLKEMSFENDICEYIQTSR